jgi:hypothetical protein
MPLLCIISKEVVFVPLDAGEPLFGTALNL